MAEAYPIEVRLMPQYKNGSARWFTPTQARNYYGKYSRTGITIHWWGAIGQTGNHDQTANYISNKLAGSANYVLSDSKITLLVGPDNVAFTSQAGNPTTISVEHQPNLGAEGYKKAGWLIWQLEQRYGRRLTLYPHKYWFNTACPGTLDLNRMRAEADKWAAGGYNPAPTPPVVTDPPKVVTLQITDIPNKKVRLIRNANLWNLQFSRYSDAKAVKTLSAGTEVEVSATAKHPLGSTYYLSQYSFEKGIGNGINVKDCEDVGTPPPPPPTPPKPEPVPVPLPTKDEQQDEEIKQVKSLLGRIVQFLKDKFGFGG